MTPNQGGGIKGKSTADHLLRIINFIKANKLKKQKPILVFLDVTTPTQEKTPGTHK